MEVSDSIAKLCGVCSKLDIHSLTHPLYPCRDPLPCSMPPIEGIMGAYTILGSIDEIKSRRSTCDICKLIAEVLDKEPPDLDGECRMKETEECCNFKLPPNVEARDPSITHFHFAQTSVMFDTSVANNFQGPALPWELKAKDIRANHYIIGFQVKASARPCTETGDANSVYPKVEQEFLDTIGGRYVTTQVDTQLIRSWLHQCESKHGKNCTPSLRLPTNRDREPTFVVDVIESCLVDTPSQCRYVALSYVWGTAPVFRHLLENTQEIRKTNSLRSLPIPATIRDAMTLVHAIGERYLWVDSICIIQNDVKMQQTEIIRMGSIYSKALFTIIAAGGDHANTGLAGVERGSREQVQKILKLADRELLTVIEIHRPTSGIDDMAWAQRAWTFQERVLSNRVLVFSENQVYWNCRVASHSEERALEEVRDVRRLHSSFPQKHFIDSLSWEPLQPAGYCDIYYNLLSGYRQRRLTYQTDILNAFNGISEILTELQNDTFLWGLPESLFSYAMTWSFTGYSARNCVNVPIFESDDAKETIPIPSWSWAAWSGEDPDYLPFLHAGASTDVRPIIQFDIVDQNHQLVRIKESSWQNHPDDRVRTLWTNEQPHQLGQSPTQHFPFQIGQLRFWTSFANVKALRHTGFQGEMIYILFPPPEAQPDGANSEFVYQDFIVVAARNTETLALLAVEWKDGVAYRVGSAEVEEANWVGIENRQWRLIALG